MRLPVNELCIKKYKTLNKLDTMCMLSFAYSLTSIVASGKTNLGATSAVDHYYLHLFCDILIGFNFMKSCGTMNELGQ